MTTKLWTETYRESQDSCTRIIDWAPAIGAQFFVLNHVAHTADMLMLINSTQYLVEVKSHNNKNRYPTFPAEVFACPATATLTEYLLDGACDLVVQHDTVTDRLYWYRQPALRAYVLERAHTSTAFKHSNASGILIPWECHEAGFFRVDDL